MGDSMREEQYERIKNLAKKFEEVLQWQRGYWRSDLRNCFYGMYDILTECKECSGKGYVTEYITECNGGESAPEWAGEYQVQCYCTYEMSLQDEIEYEKWQERGELNESENSNTC